MNRLKYLGFLAALCAVFTATTHINLAYSDDTVAITEKPEQVINYSQIESLGLLSAESSDNLGNDLYRNTKRSNLNHMLENPNQSSSVAIRLAVKNMLITSADSTVLGQDVAITSGHNLLTLRINALLHLGYNREAYQLYFKASENALDEPTMKAGVMAMLLNQEKALACLEVKTVIKEFKNIPFWAEMNTYCSISLSNNAEKTADSSNMKPLVKNILNDSNYIFEYDNNLFSNLSPIERAIITAEDRISLPKLDKGQISKLPANHIAALLKQSRVTPDTKAMLIAQSIKYGIDAPSSLEDFYKELVETYKDNSAKDTPEILLLARLYEEANKSWIINPPKEALEKAFDISRNYDDLLIIPFLPIIVKMNIGSDISLDNTIRAEKLFLYTPIMIPEKWIETLLEMQGTDNHDAVAKALIPLIVMANTNDKELKSSIDEYIQNHMNSTEKTINVKYIIENVDSGSDNGDKVHYENANGFDLIWNKMYTMPPYAVLYALSKSSESQDICLTLLLSSRITSEIEMQGLYIGTVSDIVIALNNVGLKETSRKVLAQALMYKDEE